VRELENTIARACALANSPILLAADIPFAVAPVNRGGLNEALEKILLHAPSSDAIPWIISQIAQRAVELADNDLKQAAAQLGMKMDELKKHLNS
jgi:DNA-binding NtrC family response regulator